MTVKGYILKFRLKDLKNVDKKWQAYALAGCVCILFYLGLTHIGKIWGVFKNIWAIFSSVFIGFVIAYIINPIAVWFNDKVFAKIKKENIRWKLSAVVALLLVFCLLALLMFMLIPEIIDSVVSLVDNYESYVTRIKDFLSNGPLGGFEFVQNFIVFISEQVS